MLTPTFKQVLKMLSTKNTLNEGLFKYIQDKFTE